MKADNLQPNQLLELLHASKLLNSTLQLNTLLQYITDASCRMAQAERTTMYIVDHESNELWTRQMAGEKIQEFRLPMGTGIAGHAAETGRVSCLADAYTSKYFNSDFDKKTGFRTKALLTVPFKGRDKKVVGVIQVLNQVDGGSFQKSEQLSIEHLGDYAALAIENALFVEALQEKKRLEDDLIAAERVQMNLLPSSIPEFPNLSIAARYIPCLAVGGDLYDVIELKDSNVGLALGDIVGKGLTAALMMATLQALFRMEARRGGSPHETVDSMNKLFFESTASHEFATFFYGIMNYESGLLRICSAGHDPAIIVNAQGDLIDVGRGGLLLGLMEGSEFSTTDIQMEKGTICAVYSDGLTEQHNPKDEQFGMERLQEALQESRKKSPQEIVAHVESKISDFSEGRKHDDDFTILVWKWD